ncbi:MAG: PAS domain S-box protein [Acidobacteriales bacterium]|nr:PAS domain S-box protein [Terriglobales bacterium]
MEPAPHRSPYIPVALFLLVSAAITIGAYRYNADERTVIDREVHNQLLTIADLKVQQLTDWRRERFGDAHALMSNRMMMPALERLINGEAGRREREEVLAWMQEIREQLRYTNVFLTDRKGTVVLQVGQPMGSEGHFEQAAREVISTGAPVLRDFHAGGGTRIHLGLNLPLSRSPQSPEFGFLMLGIDPAEHLDRIIQSWPAPSDSAETLLVRRDGDDVVFLNELRHRKGTALALRIPLSRTEVAAVQGVLGKEGAISAVDYRGVPILAAIRRVPDSPWILVAKVDQDEVYEPIRQRSITMALIVALMIFAAGAVVLLLWRRQQVRFYREKYEAEIERRALLGHFDYLTRFANDIILLSDESGRIVEANDRAVAAYGYPREELIGMMARDLRHPSAVDSFEDDWHCAARQGDAIFETVHRRKDGSPLQIEVSTRTIEVEGRKFFQGIFRDISERNAIVEKLRKTVSTLNALVDASPAAIIALTVTGEVTLWNRSAEKIFGYRSEELLGRPLPEQFVTAEDWTQRRQALLAGKSTGPAEIRRPRKDGTIVDLSVSAAPVLDAQGTVVSTVSVMLDITEQKRIQREQRILGETLAASLNEIYLFNSDTLRFRYVNQAALDNLGYTLEQMQSMTPLDIKPDFTREQYEVLLRPLLTGEVKLQIFEAVYRRADGSTYPVEVHLQLFEHDGVRVFLALVLDITERRRAEEALRRSEAQLVHSQRMEGIGRLAGGVAHDFNNYLTVINGYCEMMLRKLPAGDALHEQISHVRQAGEQAARLTKQLLAFSRKQVLEPRVINLNGVITETQRMLQRLIGEDIELITRLDPALDTVTADPGQMGQVLMNLLVNARDAMPHGGKVIIETANVELDKAYVERHPQVKPGAYVLLAVSDTGVGMDPETQKRVFEPFFTTKNPGEGTGLGLATVYGIVRQSGGWIWLYSEPGRGTTFKIYLARTAAGAQPAPEVKAPEFVRGSETVLVVEDQPDVRKLTVSVLRDAGYRVLEAANGAAALQHFAEGNAPIDLLFTDVIMPGMTGRDLAARVAELSPATRLLYTSGYTANIIAQRGILEEGVDYLPKPFTPNRLLTAVREILDRAPAPGAPRAL